jgi:hypothetical protein
VLGLAVDGLMTKPHGTSDAESGRTPYRVIPGFKNFFLQKILEARKYSLPNSG